MRTGLLFSLVLLLAIAMPLHAEIFRWVDAQGNVVYGDKPPKQTAAQAVNLPTLTVADSFTPAPNAPAAKPEEPQASAYSDFKVSTPTTDEEVRANDGNVTVTLALQPQLQPNDGITLYLDGKQVANGAQLSFNLSEVERGEHSVFAVLNDATGNIIQNTETVKFNVLRQTVLQGKNN